MGAWAGPAPRPVNTWEWGCSICSLPWHPQSPLTPSIPPRSRCGMSLSSRARSTSSPPTATAPWSTASAPSAPARSRAGREWGSRGTATPRCCGTPRTAGGLEDGGLQCLLPPEPWGCLLRAPPGAASTARAVSGAVGTPGVSPLPPRQVGRLRALRLPGAAVRAGARRVPVLGGVERQQRLPRGEDVLLPPHRLRRECPRPGSPRGAAPGAHRWPPTGWQCQSRARLGRRTTGGAG